VLREPYPLLEARRILVIGCGGAGKSTFAHRLGRAVSLPVVHLDSYFWNPGWIETEREAWEAQVRELTCGERWVMDGNYGDTMEERLLAADAAVFLDAPRLLCLWRVVRRRLTYAGRTRPDMGEGCPERLDAAFLRYIWRYPYDRRPGVLERLGQHSGITQVFVLRVPGESRHFLDDLESAARLARERRS
jgi:adenylate kinase family enzyme